ncbi:MAG TPA: hypothetical protein VFQ44_02400 [Streptosporangiaceae bacterium]|nr:hypothetical protein [Streptosporangiaceae bacterium]
MTIKFEVKPVKGEEGSRVDVAGTVAITPPKRQQAGVFFVTQEYGLSRDDPSYEKPLMPAAPYDRP